MRSLEELEEALEAGADLILLDNFPLEALREAVRRVGVNRAGRAAPRLRMSACR